MRPRVRQPIVYVVAAVLAGALFGVLQDSVAAGVVFGIAWGVTFAFLVQRFGVRDVAAKGERERAQQRPGDR